MLLLLLGFGVFFLHHDMDVILSSAHIFWPCAAGVLFWLASVVFTVISGITLAKKSQCANNFRNYLAVDRAVLCCLLVMVCLVSAFLLDLVKYPDHSNVIDWGDKRITVYHDKAPLKLEDLDIAVQGNFRSTRAIERSGFILSSLSVSDQSFSDPDSSRDLSMISYSIYRCSWKTGLDWVARQQGISRYPIAENLNELWQSAEVHSDGRNKVIALYPDAVLVFSVIPGLSEVDPSIILDKLSLPN